VQGKRAASGKIRRRLALPLMRVARVRGGPPEILRLQLFQLFVFFVALLYIQVTCSQYRFISPMVEHRTRLLSTCSMLQVVVNGTRSPPAAPFQIFHGSFQIADASSPNPGRDIFSSVHGLKTEQFSEGSPSNCDDTLTTMKDHVRKSECW
jgi:hypothetical protein